MACGLANTKAVFMIERCDRRCARRTCAGVALGTLGRTVLQRGGHRAIPCAADACFLAAHGVRSSCFARGICVLASHILAEMSYSQGVDSAAGTDLCALLSALWTVSQQVRSGFGVPNSARLRHFGNATRCFGRVAPRKCLSNQKYKIPQYYPYSPDQGGPPDNTSGVEAPCILLQVKIRL